MKVDTLFNRVKQVDLYGLLEVEKAKIKEDGTEGVWVRFWRIGGAFKKDKTARISMVLDPDGPGGDLFFYAPSLEKCEPRDIALTIYMDANKRTIHGAHRWEAGEKGAVIFSYSLPLPPDNDDFPGTGLLQELLKDMYEGLLFRELKDLEMRIDRDDMLTEEEKKAKFAKVMEMFKRLTNPKKDDGAV